MREKRKELRATPDSGEEDVTSENPLAKSMKTAKVTGKGVQMVEKIAMMFAEDEDHTPRRLIRTPTVSDVFQVGLEDLELSFEDDPDAWSDIESVAGQRKANVPPKTYQKS